MRPNDFHIRTFEIPGLPQFDMSFVKGGVAKVGSEHEESYEVEKPVHEVELSEFYLGCHPVWQGHYESVMGSNPSRFVASLRPVEYVSWDDAKEFVEKLNEKAKRVYPNGKFHLPSEHQWEYAARGGVFAPEHDSERYSGSDEIEEVGWNKATSYDSSQVPGLKRPNALGLFDMSGNVWEWCADDWDVDYYQTLARKKDPKPDPVNLTKSELKAIHGGSWFDSPWKCRLACRQWRQPHATSVNQGFRLLFQFDQKPGEWSAGTSCRR